MKKKNISKGLLDFIAQCPSCYHVIDYLRRILISRGYTELSEKETWKISKGGKYFAVRNSSSIIAFRIPKKKPDGLHIIASHSDSPTFTIKPNPEIPSEGIIRLNVEKYGGMIPRSWFDRPLSVAGRVFVKSPEGPVQRLVYINRDLLLIPSLAIHMTRDSDKKDSISIQNEMLPLFSQNEKETLISRIAKEIKEKPADILGNDLFLVSRDRPCIWGAESEFISSPRLDDLECAYSSFEGFIDSQDEENAGISMLCIFDNEEVGSRTKQGAESTFLADVTERIFEGLKMDRQTSLSLIASSFMVSADNAHAVHPNYASKADPTNRPKMNKGIVLKHSANQKYTTDGASAAIFKMICEGADIPYQEFANNSDTPGGSTLGNIANTQISMNTADIGLAQLAMHSAYETAGAEDAEHLRSFSEEFYKEPLPVISIR